MKPINAAAATFVIPCYSPSKESASRLLAAWGGLAALGVSLETFTDGESFVRRLRELDHNKVPVPVVWVEGPLDVKAVEWGGRLRELPVGWSQSQLQSELRGALTAYLMESVPGELERFSEWLDPSLLARAFRDLHASKQALDSQMDALRSGLTGMASASDKTVEEALIEGIDLALDRPARQAFKPGEVLLKEGEPVHGIWIVLDGEVELLRRARQREIVFHSQSAGRIVGLIALAQRRQAFHTCRAKTNVTVAFLTWEQLDRALRKDPWLTVHLVSVLVKSMTRRLRKIGRLQLQVEDLNDILAAERDQLSQALQRLEQAQIRLIESEKMATLGQLSAGVAHELNNPITAIRRVSDYIAEDLDALVRSCPDEKLIRGFMSSAMTEAPPSTAEIRRRAAELSILTGGAAEAGRLAKLGITDQKEYRQWCGEVSPERREARLSLMERAHELGLSLRSLRASADRVVAIVGSLKSYA
ncbi:MAG: cyclic nucleotide-binding domain-containing protein, partial [Oligoflexia bacterium]|nr:cyclic nucleotide-binding domain-containing protein [Oligoflexia bacterium]